MGDWTWTSAPLMCLTKSLDLHPHHIQRVGGAHGDDARPSARSQPQQRRHAPVTALIERRVRDVPACGKTCLFIGRLR